MIKTIKETARLIVIWISGYLFASGLLLSYPHNPLWALPSLVLLIGLLVGSLLENRIKKEDPKK